MGIDKGCTITRSGEANVRTSRRRGVIATAAGILCLLVLVGYVAMWTDVRPGFLPDAGGRSGSREPTVEELSAFADFPLYWVGPEYAGLPLTRITRYVPPGGALGSAKIVMLAYGTCEIGENATGCAPPLTIRIETPCRPSSSYAHAFGDRILDVRGAPAAVITGHLRIWTKGAELTLYTNGPHGIDAQEAAGDQ